MEMQACTDATTRCDDDFSDELDDGPSLGRRPRATADRILDGKASAAALLEELGALIDPLALSAAAREALLKEVLMDAVPRPFAVQRKEAPPAPPQDFRFAFA